MTQDKPAEDVKAAFLVDVKKHQMTVMHDDRLYRHLRFRRPTDLAYHFDLITWPDHLCCTGDMGTFVFAKGGDMFGLFRTEEGKIRPDYWAEKLVAVCGDRYEGRAYEFDKRAFKKAVKEYLAGWLEDLSDARDRQELEEQVCEEILDCVDEDERGNYERVRDFRGRVDGTKFEFDDFFDQVYKRPTYHYLWACHAISWGVRRYDEKYAAEERAVRSHLAAMESAARQAGET